MANFKSAERENAWNEKDRVHFSRESGNYAKNVYRFSLWAFVTAIFSCRLPRLFNVKFSRRIYPIPSGTSELVPNYVLLSWKGRNATSCDSMLIWQLSSNDWTYKKSRDLFLNPLRSTKNSMNQRYLLNRNSPSLNASVDHLPSTRVLFEQIVLLSCSLISSFSYPYQCKISPVVVSTLSSFDGNFWDWSNPRNHS